MSTYDVQSFGHQDSGYSYHQEMEMDGFNAHIDPQYIIENDSCSPRGETHSPFIGFFSSKFLRTGFILQVLALSLMFVFYWAFGGSGIFIFDLYAASENVKLSQSFHLAVSTLMGIYIMGTLYIALFQVFVADNSKLVRGFRAGSKILSAAVTLDFISSVLRMVQYIYAYYYMSMKWWTKYQQTKADWIFFQFGSFVHSFSLIMYGAAFFYLEAYHDEGTQEEFAWVNMILFGLSGLAELLMVFTGFGSLFSLLLLVSILCATTWAMSFEPLLEKWSPALHSRDVNADFAPESKEGYGSDSTYYQMQSVPEGPVDVGAYGPGMDQYQQ